MIFEYDYYAGYDLPPWLWVLSAILSVVGIIANWKVFAKAGQAGWKSLIPIYNIYILFKIAWGSGWKFLWLLVPLVNIVVAIRVMLKLARSFGKSTGFGIGLILLGPIFLMMLAFGDARYQGPES